MKQVVEGTVTSYAPRTGVAQVDADGEQLELFTGCFFSGLPVRHPQKGDRVKMHVQDGRVTLGHLVK